MKRLLLVACLALLCPVVAVGQRLSPPKTEAEGQLRALRQWTLSKNLSARAQEFVFPEWVAAVERHTPGEADEAAIRIGNWPGEDLDLLVKWVSVQLQVSESVRLANHLVPKVRVVELARRGTVLHADIALRVGSARQTTLRISPFAYSAMEAEDGRAAGVTEAGVHMEVARALLTVLRDAGCADPEFDSLWFRATAAAMLYKRKIGFATPHLRAGLDAIPEDAVLLFYSATSHETLAGPRSQRVLEAVRPPRGVSWHVASEEEELQAAEKLLARALRFAPDNPEIRLHHARVIGCLGQHAKAAAELRAVDGKLTDPVLAYYAALFRGYEEAALGHRDLARDGYERAAALVPTAQSPLLGLSSLARRYGDRAGAVAALRRVFALPASNSLSLDPWWDYYESHVRDAGALLNQLYGRYSQKGTR